MARFPGEIFFEGKGAGIHRQRYTVGHASFTAAALTEAVSMTVTHPAGTLITTASHRLDATFTGTGITAAAIDVGINGGNLDEYVAAVDVFTAPIPYGPAIGDGTAPVGALVTTTIDFARVDEDPEPLTS